MWFCRSWPPKYNLLRDTKYKGRLCHGTPDLRWLGSQPFPNVETARLHDCEIISCESLLDRNGRKITSNGRKLHLREYHWFSYCHFSYANTIFSRCWFYPWPFLVNYQQWNPMHISTSLSGFKLVGMVLPFYKDCDALNFKTTALVGEPSLSRGTPLINTGLSLRLLSQVAIATPCHPISTAEIPQIRTLRINSIQCNSWNKKHQDTKCHIKRQRKTPSAPQPATSQDPTAAWKHGPPAETLIFNDDTRHTQAFQLLHGEGEDLQRPDPKLYGFRTISPVAYSLSCF